MAARFTVRHRCYYRSRVQFPLLRGNAALCREVEKLIASFPGIDSIEARPRTGSVIILHRQGFSDFAALAERIACLPQQKREKASLSSAPPAKKPPEKRYHVSGLSLFFSGLYLAYLSLKRLAVTTVSSSLFRLPTLVTLGLAAPIQRQAIDNLKKNGRPDMGLISTGLLYYSLFTGNVLAAYTIFWLFNLSGWLESRIQQRTRQTIREMLLAKEEKVWLQKDGMELEVAAESLQTGDMVVLRLGSVVPVDGVIRQGEAFVDESMLTGEATAVVRTAGDHVLSGTVISSGEIVVEAEKTGEKTRLASIVRTVEAAENDPGELQQFSQRISQTMVPVSLGIFTVGFLLTGNLMQAMALLVIGCPCVLRLSSSVAISSQVARASSEGLLVKGGRYLELAAQMDTLVIDKTGTLTIAGNEALNLTVLDRRFSKEYLLRLASGMQRQWPHPAGRGLQAMVAREGLEPITFHQADFTIGAGVRAVLEGEEILFGSKQFLLDAGVSFSSRKEKIITDVVNRSCSGNSRFFLARGGQPLACFTASQQLRGGEAEALASLRAGGVRHLVLLSGDGGEGVQQTAESLGFDEVLSGQSPEQKAEWIRTYRQKNQGAVIGMVGDGINDTPAFAAADISFAIADGGAEVTVEYGDVVVQYGGIAQVARFQELAAGVNRKIKTGYTAAIALNSVVFVGTAAGLLSPLTGALLHNGITVAVVGYTAAGER